MADVRFFRKMLRGAVPLITVCLLLLAVGSARFRRVEAGMVAPFLTGAALVREWIERFVPLGPSGRERLARLEKRTAELTVQRALLEEVMEENRELRRILELPLPPGWRRIAAPVIARDPYAWEQRFRIGRGAADGIRPGAVVLSGAAVIGQVLDVGRTTALVVTPADPAFRLSVRVPEAGGIGVLRGGVRRRENGRPVVLLDYMLRDRPYKPGQRVVTSGLSQWAPGSLPVGTLTGVHGAAVEVVRTLYAQAGVVLAADLSWRRFVTVLAPAGNGGTAPKENTQ